MKDSEKISMFSTESQEEPNNSLWLYYDTIQPPSFKKDEEYSEECKRLSQIQNSLEQFLKDYIMVNSFLLDECRNQETKIAKNKLLLAEFDNGSGSKRSRRSNKELGKNIQCQFEGCAKIYGTKDALN